MANYGFRHEDVDTEGSECMQQTVGIHPVRRNRNLSGSSFIHSLPPEKDASALRTVTADVCQPTVSHDSLPENAVLPALPYLPEGAL